MGGERLATPFVFPMVQTKWHRACENALTCGRAMGESIAFLASVLEEGIVELSQARIERAKRLLM
jgi:hypothetical protein